ncbi:hypothetical protein [Micromonospora sp. LOL_021]|uniref:hypothetical protein n=1 Tax=Micromonospora sp. LOL_021 TaxID=3345417 RepID=UPI003A87A31B
MSRQELAEAVNNYLWDKHRRRVALDDTYVGKLERGRHRWPQALYREAFRAVLGVASDKELGFYIVRSSSSPLPNRTPGNGSSAGLALSLVSSELSARRDQENRVSSGGTAPYLLPEPDKMLQAIEAANGEGLLYADRLSRLQEKVREHAANVATMAPADMIRHITPDLIDANMMLRYARNVDDVQVLNGVIARFSAVVADEFSVLGDTKQAYSWYATAMAAADQSGATQLQAAVRALSAMVPLYNGRQADAVRLAQQAQQIANMKPCFPVALASMLEALARARLGDHCEARVALHRAQDSHDALNETDRAESFFGFSLRRRLFYEGRVRTMVGEYDAAQKTHRQARQLYSPQVVGDPAIMSLDRAMALIETNEPEAGSQLIVETLSSLPVSHRQGIFLSLANRVFAATPIAARNLPGPRECAELLDGMSNS